MSNSAPEVKSGAAGDGATGFTHRQIMTALSGLLLAVLIGALDQTIVATAMRTISDQLHGETVQSWATTGYLVSSTVAMPFYGKLSDIYGRKPLYLSAIMIFVVGSFACGLASSMSQLALFRVLQGLGGAGLMSLPTAIVADLAPVRERGRYFAYLQIAWVAASLLGPLIGGTFAGTNSILGLSGWRWAFLINLPLGLFALLTVRRALNLPHQRAYQQIDYLGAAALSLGLVPLLVVAAQGLSWGWISTTAVTMYLLSVVGLILFILVERRMMAAALLPLRLFHRGGITLCIIAAFTVGVGIFGASTILPLFLQLVQNRTPTVAGLLVMPFMAGSIIAGMASGQIISWTGHFKALAIVGLGLMSGSLLVFSTMDATTPIWQVGTFSLLTGIGIGFATQVLTLAVQNAAPKDEIGVANGAAGLSRQLGGTMGVALFLSVVFSVTTARATDLLTNTAVNSDFHRALADPAVIGDPNNRRFLDLIKADGGTSIDLNDTSFLLHLDPRLAAPLVKAFSEGFQLAFLIGGLVLLVGFVLTWFFQELSTQNNDEQTKEAVEQS
jgi:MFS transporter, DHA2 family, tetracycline/oxytetracycline resistance protein